MRAQSPGAYGLSALLHGGVILLVLFFSYAATSMVKDSPKILELVAGSGDNYAATAAPALGSPGGVKLESTPVLPDPAPTPPAPKAQESPIQAAPEAPAAPAARPAKAAKPAKPVDLVASLKRVEDRRKKRMETAYEKQKAAEQKKEDLKRAQDAKASRIDAEGIREGVLGGSKDNKTGGAGGKALTREEGSELDAYFSLLKTRIKENHTPPEGVSDSLEARLEFFVAADGSLSHVHIVKSSGNTEFDRSVIEACQQTHSIGPRPDGRSETVEMTFKMREDDSS